MKKLLTTIFAISSIGLFAGQTASHDLTINAPAAYTDITVTSTIPTIGSGEWTWNFESNKFEASVTDTTLTYCKQSATDQKIEAKLNNPVATGLTISMTGDGNVTGTIAELSISDQTLVSQISVNEEGSGAITFDCFATHVFEGSYSATVTYTIADDTAV